MKLQDSLLIGLLEQSQHSVALFGGGFKPPTKGHFDVVAKTIKQFPNLTKIYIVVGDVPRGGITQEQSLNIWEIYKKYLPGSVKIVKSQSPVYYIKEYIKLNPEINKYAIVGSRVGDVNDEHDLKKRVKLYGKDASNLTIKNIYSDYNISATQTRDALKNSKDEFFKFIPEKLSPQDKEKVYNILSPQINESKNNMDSTPKDDLIKHIKLLTKFMVNEELNVKPLPKIKFIDDDVENSKNTLGKTAYYDPTEKLIVLYTYGRHNKDILRSYSHEMIHHIQNLEKRLHDISTTDTTQDEFLQEIEREAYERGNMTFRGWEDSIKN